MIKMLQIHDQPLSLLLFEYGKFLRLFTIRVSQPIMTVNNLECNLTDCLSLCSSFNIYEHSTVYVIAFIQPIIGCIIIKYRINALIQCTEKWDAFQATVSKRHFKWLCILNEPLITYLSTRTFLQAIKFLCIHSAIQL